MPGHTANRRAAVRAGQALAALALTGGLLVACSTPPDPLDQPGAVPETRRGSSTPVDACALTTAAERRRAAGTPLRQVGYVYGSPAVLTTTCWFGTTFADPVLTTSFAAGPVAPRTFEQAYGVDAGGDPQPVERLGQAAYLRAEGDLVSVYVLAHGAVLTLQARDRGVPRVGEGRLLALTRAVAARLPRNPGVAALPTTPECAGVPSGVVRSALTAPATRGSGFADGPDLLCTWTSQPGVAEVTLLRSPRSVRQYQRSFDRSLFVPVRDFPRGPDGPEGPAPRVWTDPERSGDLIVLGPGYVLVQGVVPVAGPPDVALPPSPAEIDLAMSFLP